MKPASTLKVAKHQLRAVSQAKTQVSEAIGVSQIKKQTVIVLVLAGEVFWLCFRSLFFF